MPKTKTEEMYLVPELNIKIPISWIRLIRFVQTSLPHGQLCVKIVNCEPTDLVKEHTVERIRFDKEESIPNGVDFSRS